MAVGLNRVGIHVIGASRYVHNVFQNRSLLSAKHSTGQRRQAPVKFKLIHYQLPGPSRREHHANTPHVAARGRKVAESMSEGIRQDVGLPS